MTNFFPPNGRAARAIANTKDAGFLRQRLFGFSDNMPGEGATPFPRIPLGRNETACDDARELD